ncbi:hypothetical protein VTK73DRAFT_10038 [Phialemonium thermophilum]|uniref:Major facilitator superfamily (MFS) profile domain-containing protein n=1 Tax=Phialemonium thermophilum TaxID=223376 RepID=A0ABR3XIR5_9PEZI
MGGLKEIFTESTIAKYVRVIRASPRSLVANKRLLWTTLLFSMAGTPLTLDQGSSSLIPSLPGFEKEFHMDSGSDAATISNFVSIVYVGAAVGAALSFFFNDRIGRLWSLRLYFFIWMVGQLIATGSSGKLSALYAARVISGVGIGSLTVTGPMSIVEIAPAETRGLLSAWFSIAFMLTLFISTIAVYGISLHMAPSPLQYQVVWFSCAIFAALVIGASFFASETPRWLFLMGRDEEATTALLQLRGLPADHPRVVSELNDIKTQIAQELGEFGGVGEKVSWFQNFKAVAREAFLVPSNLRRLQQASVAFALAQLSGANSVTSYLVPILTLVGVNADGSKKLLLSGMYSLAKLFFTIITSFFFVDALGRRKSLFLGIAVQMISHIYIGCYLKFKAEGPVSTSSGTAAVVMIFFHGFGYSAGLLVLPYVFGGELWPNRIRSFGASFSQFFHWIFFYAILKATPSILSSMDNWGAFLFFAGWCFLALVYVFLTVPEISGLNMEQTDELFKGPWFSIRRRSKKHVLQVVDGIDHVDQDADLKGSDKVAAAEAGLV